MAVMKQALLSVSDKTGLADFARGLAARHRYAARHRHAPRHRHAERHPHVAVRLAFVALLASRIAPGGYLHCATDWQEYAEQMLEVLSGEPTLANTAEGYAPRPDYRPVTKFENRGLRLGRGAGGRRRDGRAPGGPTRRSASALTSSASSPMGLSEGETGPLF